MLYQEQVNPADLGAGTTPELPLLDNEVLQRAIARSFVAQAFPAVLDREVKLRPSEIVAILIEALAPGRAARETYTIGIFQRDGGGGHALTSYAVVDHGGGLTGIQIYDNNHPGEDREILVNTEADLWAYHGSPNPDDAENVYSGDAGTFSLILYPTTPGLGVQPCDFCRDGAAAAASAAQAGVGRLGSVALVGGRRNHARLVLTDDKGRRSGMVKGKLVNEIPGVKVVRPLWKRNSRARRRRKMKLKANELRLARERFL